MSKRLDRPRAAPLDLDAALGGNKFNAFEEVQLVGDEGYYAATYQNTGSIVIGNVMKEKGDVQTIASPSAIVTWTVSAKAIASVHEDDTLQIIVIDDDVGPPKVERAKQTDHLGKGSMKKVQTLLLDRQRVYGVCSDKVYVWLRTNLTAKARNIPLKDSNPKSRVIINSKQSFSQVIGPNILLLANNDVAQEWKIDLVEDKMELGFDGRSPDSKFKFLHLWCRFPTLLTTNRDTVLLWDCQQPLNDAKGTPSGNPREYKEKGMLTACCQDDTFLIVGDNSGLITARSRRGAELLYELNRAEQIAVEEGSLIEFNLANRVTVLKKVGRWVFAGSENGSIQIFDLTKEKADCVAEFKTPGGGIVRDIRLNTGILIAIVAPPKDADKKKIKKKSKDGGAIPSAVVWAPRLPLLEVYPQYLESPETNELTLLLFASYKQISGFLGKVESAGEDVVEFQATVERVMQIVSDLVGSPRLLTFLSLRALQTALDDYEQLLSKLAGAGRLVRFFSSSRLRRDLEFHNGNLHRGLIQVEDELKARASQLHQQASAGLLPPPTEKPGRSILASEYGGLDDNLFIASPKSEYAVLEDTAGRQKVSMIADVEGAHFWEAVFRNEMMVEWPLFVNALRTRFGASFGPTEERQMQSILDHSNSKYVSQYKFSEFLKGFGPFSLCIANVVDTLAQPWFHGFLSSRESELLMTVDDEPAGTFLIRFSKSKPGSFALAFLKDAQHANHILIESCKPEGFRISDQASVGRTKLFQSLHEIVQHYQYVLKRPYMSQLPARPWFHGDLSTDETKDFLEDQPTGTYLIRFSSKGCFAASFIEHLPGRPHPELKHVLISNQGKTKYSINTGTGSTLLFPSMTELVRYYFEKGVFKYPLKTVNKYGDDLPT